MSHQRSILNYARVTRNDHELTLQINEANQENIFKSKQGTTNAAETND